MSWRAMSEEEEVTRRKQKTKSKKWKRTVEVEREKISENDPPLLVVSEGRLIDDLLWPYTNSIISR